MGVRRQRFRWVPLDKHEECSDWSGYNLKEIEKANGTRKVPHMAEKGLVVAGLSLSADG